MCCFFLVMINNMYYLVKDTKNSFLNKLPKQAVVAEKTICTKALRFCVL